MKLHTAILGYFALFLYIRPDTKVKFYGCNNCELLRYFRSSDLVIYQSKLLSSSSSMPCISSIITHLIGH